MSTDTADGTTSEAILGVGIVGLSAAGGWAAGAHVPALAHLPGFELRGLVASTPASAKAAGTKFGVDCAVDDVADLVANDAIDLVVITVKVPEHQRLVMTALEAGKAVLCEWPLGNGLTEAVAMADAAAARGVPAFVGLQGRSAPAIRYLADLIGDGYVGEVLSTTMIGSGGNWGATVDPRNAYTLDAANGATMLTIPFGHSIDAFSTVLGEFASLTATVATRRGEVIEQPSGTALPMSAPDQVAVTGVLETGAVAAVHFRGGMSRATNLHWEINGTDGVLTGNSGHVQMAALTIAGARGDDRTPVTLEVPEQYFAVSRDLRESAPRAYNVACAYSRIHADLTRGTRSAPTFADAVRRHRFLASVDHNAPVE